MIPRSCPLPGRAPCALAALTFVLAFFMAACATSPPPLGTGQRPPTSSVRPGASTVAACVGAAIRIRAGREGENGGVHVDIEFTNVGHHRCMLRGVPRVIVLRANGRPLPARIVRAGNLSLSPVALPPGKPNAADLVTFWANWCGQPPGPLSVRVTLPNGDLITGLLSGPTSRYDLVPSCSSPRQPSAISVLDAYAVRAPPGSGDRTTRHPLSG
jgi:hypothetical protein